MNIQKLGRSFALLLSLFLIFTSTIQSTMAYIVTKTPLVINTFIPFQSITSDLVINKAVEHPYGAGYNIPDNIAFDFEVNLGSYYAGSKIQTTDGEKIADENGKITVSAKANTSVGVSGLDEGTKVTVTELQKPNSGFSVKDGQSVKETTIVADGNTGVDYINVYQPEKVKLDNVNVKGTKVLEGGNWQEGYTYTFILGQEVRPSEWTTIGTTTVTYDANNKNFNQFDFSSIFHNMEFDQLGTYSFRISEVKGKIENITYDETVHNVSVVINDKDMDGKMELESVTLNDQLVLPDAQTGKYDVDVTFNNEFTPDKTEVPITVDKTMMCLNTKANVGPENFGFVLENIDTGEKQTLKTDAQGKAVFNLEFTSNDIGKTFNYKISEINDGRANITYSTAVYNIQIKVELGTDNKLDADVIYEGVEVENFVAGFTNIYKDSRPGATGDKNSPVLWMAMFVAGATILVVLWATRKKKNK